MREGESEVLDEQDPGWPGRWEGNQPAGPHKGRAGLCPGASVLGPSDLGAILSSVTSSVITFQCLKALKEKLQFKRKTLHALFAYEWRLYN